MNQRLKPFVLSLSKHEWFKSLLPDFSVHPSTSSGRTEKSESKVIVIGCAEERSASVEFYAIDAPPVVGTSYIYPIEKQ